MEAFGARFIPCAFARYREEKMKHRDSRMKEAARRFVLYGGYMDRDCAPEAGAGL